MFLHASGNILYYGLLLIVQHISEIVHTAVSLAAITVYCNWKMMINWFPFPPCVECKIHMNHENSCTDFVREKNSFSIFSATDINC